MVVRESVSRFGAYSMTTGRRRRDGPSGPCITVLRATTCSFSDQGAAIVLGWGYILGKSLLVTVKTTREPSGNTYAVDPRLMRIGVA